MIRESNGYIYLITEKTNYIIKVMENGALRHVYYGAPLGEEPIDYYGLVRRCSWGISSGGYSPETMSSEYPTFGRGDYRMPSFMFEAPNGRRVSELKYISHKSYKGKAPIKGLPSLDKNTDNIDTIEITLLDEVYNVEVVLFYSVFEKENIIARHTVIKNCSEGDVKLLRAASASIDFDATEFDMVTLNGAWARERDIERYPLHQGISSIESRRGTSSHLLNPFAAFCDKETTEDFGDVYGVSLVYSADFMIAAEKNQFNCTRVMLGVNPETFSWNLKPGDSFETPEALLTYSNEGFNGMSHNFHAVCRGYLGRSADKSIVHPIVINNWEAMYFDISEERIKKFICDCKGLGIDTFVMDDGWFGHRDTDNSSLGDWYVYEKKLPNGLDAIIEACHENGMKFGIWFEPEMVCRDSDLFRAHPDWCIHSPGRDPLESRTQLVLDMSRPEVVDCIFEQMSKILGKYDVSYVKWDMNRYITDNGSDALSAASQGEHTHRYVMGVYDLMARLEEKFPNVFFEGCSGGGGRVDFGILYYMPQIWTSDNSDAIARLKIQYGTSMVYPTSSMVGHVSACPNHQTGRIVPFETRGEVAQMCNFGYELDVAKLPENEREMIASQVKKHREMEDLVQSGTYYRLLSPFKCNEAAWEIVSENKDKAYIMYAVASTVANAIPRYIKLKGLDENRMYRVVQKNITVSGKTLMNAGLAFAPQYGDYTSLAFDIVAVD